MFSISNPQGGSLLDEPVVAGPPDFSRDRGPLGLLTNQFGILSGLGFLGRFEIDVPENAMVSGVRISLFSAAGGSPASVMKDHVMGFIRDDAVWLRDGINADSYPTRLSLPWPWRRDSATFIDNTSAWVGLSDPSVFRENVAPLAAAFPYSFGDNMDATHQVSGLVSNLQAWIDSAPANVRSFSSDGTKTPCCLAILNRNLTLGFQNVYSELIGAEAIRPRLEVSFTLSGARVSGRAATSFIIDGRTNTR